MIFENGFSKTKTARESGFLFVFVSCGGSHRPYVMQNQYGEERMTRDYKALFSRLHGDREAYYGRWNHDRPLAITTARRDELRRLHQILYKCIVYMARHYREFVPQYMPLSEKEMEILEMQSRCPFRAGTYRPDYIVSEQGSLLLCEITSRFFGHGIFMSYFSDCAAEKFLQKVRQTQEEGEPLSLSSSFNESMEYMLQITEGRKEIYVLKSADKTSEIALYKPFYEACGKTVEIFEADEVEKNTDRWKKGFVIGALNQKDILSFSMTTIEAMIRAGIYNDFRTILIVHDKRFMNLWFQDAFTDRCLTAEETAFLRSHAIPTFLYKEGEEIWKKARSDKDGFILKHHRLGKSEKVYAGPLTDDRTWEELWEKGDVRDMILQPFIRQRKYATVWEGRPFEDYICGMMLCADDRYFDSGLFRASSLPVTNIGDDRKVCPIHTDDPRILQRSDIL